MDTPAAAAGETDRKVPRHHPDESEPRRADVGRKETGATGAGGLEAPEFIHFISVLIMNNFTPVLP